MADKTQIYKTSDWSIWVESPATSNTFVLDVSELNSTDVLGSTENTVKKIDARIVSITIEDGGEMNQGIFSPIIPISMTAILNIKNFTMSEVKNFYIGKTIWAMLKNAQTFSDPVYGLNTPMFTGVINTFDVSVTPGEDFSTITVQATSRAADYLNTQVSVSKVVGNNRASALYGALSASPYDFGHASYSDYWNWGTTETETKSLGEWVSDFATNNPGTIFKSYDQVSIIGLGSGGNYLYDYINGSRLDPIYTTSSSSYDQSRVFDVELGWHNAVSPTTVSLQDYPDGVIEVNVNSNPNLTSNQTTYQATVDVNGLTEMTSLANRLVSYNKNFSVTSFSTVIATDKQNLTWLETSGGLGIWHYINVKALNYTGNTINLNLSNLGISDDFVICGRTMQITTENWTNTYQLWKWK